MGGALERRLVPEVDEAGAVGRRDREIVSHPRRARFGEGRAHLCPTGLQDLAHHVRTIGETGKRVVPVSVGDDACVRWSEDLHRPPGQAAPRGRVTYLTRDRGAACWRRGRRGRRGGRWRRRGRWRHRRAPPAPVVVITLPIMI